MIDQHRFMALGLGLSLATACLAGASEPEPSSAADDGADGGDLGDTTETGEDPLALEPCAGVDLLFVIDNSHTMADEQAKLLLSAVGFIDDTAKLLPPELEFHVGVITTDSAELERQGPGGMVCPFFMGDGALPYMVHSQAMSANLDAGLVCAASVGTNGKPDERPIEMALRALGPEANLWDGPNPGFVREGAALVLVLLTDEEDDHELVTQWGSPGDPQDWAAELSELVGGVEERVVVLSLIGHEKPNACPAYQWDGSEGAELAPRLAEFTQRFEHSMVGDVCATSYGDFFADAAFVVAAACSI